MFPTTTTRTRRLNLMLAAIRARVRSEAGASTVEVLSWAAMSVVAIVAIGAALQVLGLDVINYVRTQLGV
ncbi:MAG: hypothetical protein JWM34_3324 [Ilumatobacteraceae bacterium]|nr:hypothetical protein [Ilumatobacteraceae bacterium]